MFKALLVAFAIFLIATFPATWLLMLFLGNVGLGLVVLGRAPARGDRVARAGRLVRARLVPVAGARACRSTATWS